MTTRVIRNSETVARALVGPRGLFGESLPELLLVVAVFAAVLSAALSLNGSL